MATCIYCIYNQQDVGHYFAEMMEVSSIMRKHIAQHEVEAEEAKVFQSKFASPQEDNNQVLKKIKMMTSPKMLSQLINEIIAEIMRSIRKQILHKMQKLEVVVKEPLQRRASYDDFFLCFENTNLRTGSNSYQNPFGYTGSLNSISGVFTTCAVEKQRKYNLSDSDDQSSSLSYSQRSQTSLSQPRPMRMKDGVEADSSGNCKYAIHDKQQLYLDNPFNYYETLRN